MTTTARLIGESPVRLWGLSSRQRIERQLRRLGIAVETGDSGEAGRSASTCLLVRCDFLFEIRTFRALLGREQFLLLDDDRGQVAAALVPYAQADRTEVAMEREYRCDGDRAGAGQVGESWPEGIGQGRRTALSAFDEHLRRAEAPLLEPLTPGREAYLEDLLYGNAYKGVTDLVTKWLWPRPARQLVRWCARLEISPNQVTFASFLLVILAGWFFYRGLFGPGLVAGWAMTLLDTVDGKLARVRVESSDLGNVFDHGIDLIHPPFWYLAWAAGLQGPGTNLDLTLLGWLIFGGYIGGRLAELAFRHLCGGSMFVWRPFDSWFRLVTARRNPCLIILTVSLALTAPLAGLWVLVGWTLITTAVLWMRVLQGWRARRRGGEPLSSWLEERDADDRYSASYPVFSRTRGAYGS